MHNYDNRIVFLMTSYHDSQLCSIYFNFIQFVDTVFSISFRSPCRK